MYGPQTLRRTRYNIKRQKLAQLRRDASIGLSCSITITSTSDCLVKVLPQYRATSNKKRKDDRANARKDIEAHTLKKIARNKIDVEKYQALTLDQRRRHSKIGSIIKKQIRRKYVTMEKCLETYKLVLDQMGSEANKSYINNKSLKKILTTSESDMILFMVGPLCKMDRTVVEQMDPIIRLATFIQLDRVNQLFTDSQRAHGKRGGLNHTERSAHIMNHFLKMAESFNDGAIKTALNTFWIKRIRDDDGACSRLALTVALNQQSYMSCNMTGLQTVADCLNRDLPSDASMMPCRSTIQDCRDEIATGTKAVVSATVDDDRRVYRVDFVTELINIVRLPHVQEKLKLSTELVRRHLDASYIADPAWKGCVVRVATSSQDLNSEIFRRAIDINISIDGFELAASAYGGLGLILTFKGEEMLSKINPDYDKQKDNPEFGNRAGFIYI